MNNRLSKVLKLVLVIGLVANIFACATAYDKRGVYHKVQNGETLSRIAKYYHVPIQDLAEWNNIQDSSEVVAGLKLYIPRTEKGKQPRHKQMLSRSEKTKHGTQIELDKGHFSWPVQGNVISYFGIRHERRHDGIDIKASNGAPIFAAEDGKVVFDGRLHGYGNMLIVKHGDRFYTVYAHNSKNKATKGQKVAKGEVIGYVGATRRATGTHLHFEVRQGQKARNPLFFLPAVGPENVMIATAKEHKVKEKIIKEKKPEKVKVEKKKEKVEEEKREELKEEDIKVDQEKLFSRRKSMLEDLKAKRSKLNDKKDKKDEKDETK